MSENLFRKEVASIKPYIPGKSVDELKKELGIKNIEKLASNENPLGPSPKAIEEIKKELDRIHIYPDPNCTKLKDGLCKKYDLKHENIVVGNGGEELLKIIAQTFINEGDEAIMANPTFGKYASEVLFMGGVAHQIELKDYKHDFEKFVQKINDNTKLIYVCNPNNPTGNIMTKDEIDYLVKNTPENIVLVFDEAYYEYAIKNDKYPDSLEILRKRPNTIILRTFSKVSGIASVRVGYLLTSSEITSAMNKMKMVFHVNRLAQAAGIGALNDSEHIEKTVDLNYECMGIMEKYFEENDMEYIKSNSNFVFVNVGFDSKIVFEELLKKGIIVRPGYLWDWEEWLRVSTGTKDQTRKFIDALQEVLEENKIHA